jgi:hypothetical protein
MVPTIEAHTWITIYFFQFFDFKKMEKVSKKYLIRKIIVQIHKISKKNQLKKIVHVRFMMFLGIRVTWCLNNIFKILFCTWNMVLLSWSIHV